MSDRAIRNPHDAFFRQSFGRVEFTREFLEKFLPSDVAACLDLQSLTAVPESYVDDELRQSQSDLVFSVKPAGGGEAIVYLLFEHKSYADPLTVFQLLKYVVRINEQRLRQGLPLCCVIPLVVYHGAEQWNVAYRIDELVDVAPPLVKYLPQLTIELFDLGRYDDVQLRGRVFFQAALLLLKYIYRRELVEKLPGIFGLFVDIWRQPSGLECLRLLVKYVAEGAGRFETRTIVSALEHGLKTPGEELMPTIVEEWRERGREEGRKEGREEGEVVGSIRTLQGVLGEEVTPREELLGLDAETLSQVHADLLRRARRVD